MSDQTIKNGQTLQEAWKIEYERPHLGGKIIARLVDWPNPTRYTARGEGDTVEQARLELVTMTAKAIHEDPNPFGDLGNVIHVGKVVELLESLRRGPTAGEFNSTEGEWVQHPQDPSDFYLPDQLGSDKKLPEGWEEVVGHVIDVLCSWADYYPDEETIELHDTLAVKSSIKPEGNK